MPLGSPINWKRKIVCDNCHKTIQLASLNRHKAKGCLHWRAFSVEYIEKSKIKSTEVTKIKSIDKN